MYWHRTAALALALANVLSTVCADLAEIFPMTARAWQVDSEIQMAVSASDGDVVPLLYTVIPLTTDLGLNQTQADRGVICTPRLPIAPARSSIR